MSKAEKYEVKINGNQIRQLLAKLNLKQRELAAEVGVSQVTVSNWVRGSTPSRLSVQALLPLFKKARIPVRREVPVR